MISETHLQHIVPLLDHTPETHCTPDSCNDDNSNNNSTGNSSRNSSSAEERQRYMKEKKKPQILWMLAQLQHLMANNNNTNNDNGNNVSSHEQYHIVDVGGGRGDLALCIASVFLNSRVTVIDTNEPSLNAGREKARLINLTNIQFISGDVTTMDIRKIASDPTTPVTTETTTKPVSADRLIFVGLHACGALSDYILHLSILYLSSFLICTCCFGKHHTITQHIDHTHLWFNQLQDMTTEDIISLCRLAERHESVDTAKTAMHVINSLRLSATQQALTARQTKVSLYLKSFPELLSVKNLVLYASVK